MSLFVLSVVTLVAVGLTTIDARANYPPTGLFYHRITAFTYENELDPTRLQKRYESEALCASVGKEVPYINSVQELDDLIAELNSMHRYGNLVYCDHKLVHRRFWLANNMTQKGQVLFGWRGFQYLDDNGEYCASLYWREDDQAGYRLNGQPCHRRCNTMCVRNKFYRNVHREFHDLDGPDSEFLNSVNGRFDYNGSLAKCQHYGKDLITLNSMQDMYDLQEEINRIGLWDQIQFNNFFLKNKVQGELYQPVDLTQTVAGDKCLLIGQQFASSYLGRMNTWTGPCDTARGRIISLCTDNEPGRFYNKITLYQIPCTRAEVIAHCESLGKVVPDIQTDEDVMDLGREIKRLEHQSQQFTVNRYWTTVMHNREGFLYMTEQKCGPHCVAIDAYDGGPVYEIYRLHAKHSCEQKFFGICMDP